MNEKKLPYPVDREKVRRRIEKELGLEKGKIKHYLDSGLIQFVEDYPPYLRFRRVTSKVEKGTNVFFKDKEEVKKDEDTEVDIEIIRGYPKTRRILMLEKGMKKNFDSKIFAEEKLNGYNVRITEVFGEIKALTRGGLDCPYTNERIDKEKYEEFFSENPEMMICGEVIGQNNPYIEKRYPEEKEFGYYAFDIRDKKTNVPIGVPEKKKVLDKYGINRVKEIGQYEPHEGKKLLEKIREMGKEGREGIVLKTRSMDKQLKYTSNQASNSELEYAFKFWNNYGKPFMFRRIIRQGFQAHETGLKGRELEKEAEELGKSILIPLVKTIRNIEKGEIAEEEFTLDLPSEEFAEAYKNYLRHIGLDVDIKKIEKTRKGVKVKMTRKHQATTDKTKHYLEGNKSTE
ncbi:MAG: RNA ligase [archaeon]